MIPFDASPDLMTGLVAYLDPGSGSMLLQLAIAGILSGTFVLRSSLSAARLRLARIFGHRVARP